MCLHSAFIWSGAANGRKSGLVSGFARKSQALRGCPDKPAR